MSTFRSLPYIENVIKNLSESKLETLKEFINSNEAPTINANFEELPEDDVAVVYFKLAEDIFKSGIYIAFDDTTALIIDYHTNQFQDLALFELDLVNFSYKKINEYCDINELRRLLFTSNSGGGEGDSSIIVVAKDVDLIYKSSDKSFNATIEKHYFQLIFFLNIINIT